MNNSKNILTKDGRSREMGEKGKDEYIDRKKKRKKERMRSVYDAKKAVRFCSHGLHLLQLVAKAFL